MEEENKKDIRDYFWEDWEEYNKEHPIQIEDYKIIQQKENISISI